MHELMYVSSATRVMTPEDILRILETARRNNLELGVTGLLIYHHDHQQFMQLLEGQKEVIFKLLERLKADDRHREVDVMYDGPISFRGFPNWTMAFRALPDTEGRTQSSGKPMLSSDVRQVFDRFRASLD